MLANLSIAEWLTLTTGILARAKFYFIPLAQYLCIVCGKKGYDWKCVMLLYISLIASSSACIVRVTEDWFQWYYVDSYAFSYFPRRPYDCLRRRYFGCGENVQAGIHFRWCGLLLARRSLCTIGRNRSPCTRNRYLYVGKAKARQVFRFFLFRFPVITLRLIYKFCSHSRDWRMQHGRIGLPGDGRSRPSRLGGHQGSAQTARWRCWRQCWFFRIGWGILIFWFYYFVVVVMALRLKERGSHKIVWDHGLNILYTPLVIPSSGRTHTRPLLARTLDSYSNHMFVVFLSGFLLDFWVFWLVFRTLIFPNISLAFSTNFWRFLRSEFFPGIFQNSEIFPNNS